MRYPGHFDWFAGYRALGLFDEDPIRVGEQNVIPRDVFHTLLVPRISVEVPKDVCVLRIIGRGIKDGEEKQITVDLIDYYDEETGFLAMERLTGWHCAIMMGFQARGMVRSGGVRMETAVPPADFMAELPKRGIEFTVFENVPFLITLQKGDDEFGPEANVLFDKSIKDLFVSEDVAVLAEFVVSNI